MKKLLAIVLAVVIVMGCSVAGAELTVPLRVEDLPVQPKYIVQYPEFTITYENGKYVVETDWFDVHSSAVNKSVVLTLADSFGNCIYDAERGAYVTEYSIEEGTVNMLEMSMEYPSQGVEILCSVSIGDWWIDLGFEQGYFVTPVLNQTENEVTYGYVFDEEGDVVAYSVEAEKCLYVSFDSAGNATEYEYFPSDESYKVEYQIDGTLTSLTIMVGGERYTCLNNEGVLEWKNSNWENCDPPVDYDLAKIYELYPPLTGGAQDFSIPGDADSDGEVLLDDAVAMLKNIAGQQIEISDPAADVNGDEVVDIKDILLILQYFAGWDVELK